MNETYQRKAEAACEAAPNTERCGGEVETLAPYLKRAGEIIKGQNTTIVSLSEENRMLRKPPYSEWTLADLQTELGYIQSTIERKVLGDPRTAVVMNEVDMMASLAAALSTRNVAVTVPCKLTDEMKREGVRSLRHNVNRPWEIAIELALRIRSLAQPKPECTGYAGKQCGHAECDWRGATCVPCTNCGRSREEHGVSHPDAEG